MFVDVVVLALHILLSTVSKNVCVCVQPHMRLLHTHTHQHMIIINDVAAVWRTTSHTQLHSQLFLHLHFHAYYIMHSIKG